MNSPTQILHLIARLDGYGGARMLRHVASRQADRDAHVIVAALAADPRIVRELRAAGVEVRPLRNRGAWDVVSQARLVRLVMQSTAEVVHAWDARTLALATLAQPRRFAPPCVATLGWADVNRSWSGRVVKRSWQRVACFAAADEMTCNWLAQHQVDPDRVQAIPLGIPTPPPSMRSRADLLNELSLSHDARLIAVVSPLVRSKRLDETIWDFELVRVLHPHAHLLVVGDGPDRRRLERFAQQASDSDYVHFLGFRDDVFELLQHVDVYWQMNASPTTPWALLEALAAGTPVVAVDVPAHRAVVVPSKTGCLIPPGDRAEVTRSTDQLLSDPESARRLSRDASVNIAARWPLDKALEAYDSLYRRVLVHVGAVG